MGSVSGPSPGTFHEHREVSLTALFSGAAGWAASHSLLGARLQHCSWASPGGVLLLGGLTTPLSSELLQDGSGASTEAFPLKYETKLVSQLQSWMTAWW